MNLKAFLGAVFLGATLASANAELTWEKTEIELHPKPGDQTTVANFKYTNKTNKPIKITNVRTSCGCTVASLKKNDVAPGESGEVTATLNIGGRTGLQQKFVTVETDDPAQPTVNLSLKAMVEQAMEIQPPMVFWNKGEEPKPKTITLKAAKDISISKVDVTSSTPDFTTTIEKGPAAGEFKLTVKPNDTNKASNGTLTIKPDFPQTFYATARVIEGNAAH